MDVLFAERRSRRLSPTPPPPPLHSNNNNHHHDDVDQTVTLRNVPLAAAPLPHSTVAHHQQQPASQFPPTTATGGGAARSAGARTGKKLTAADISMPTNFQHVVHVGWSAQNGFDMRDNDPNGSEQLNSFLKKAGVSQQELNDRKTRQFIYDFIESNNVLKLEADGTPVASMPAQATTSSSGGGRGGGGQPPAPPPVPSRHAVGIHR